MNCIRAPPKYNYAPLNHWIRPDERYVGGVFADYEITPAIKPYLEFMFLDDKTVAQIAPSGNFGNTFTINCDNPFLSASALAQVCQPDNYITGFIGSFPVAVRRLRLIRTGCGCRLISSTPAATATTRILPGASGATSKAVRVRTT